MEKEIYHYFKKHKNKQDSWSTREIGDAFELNVYIARYYLTILCHRGMLCRSVMQRGVPVHWRLPVRLSRRSCNFNTQISGVRQTGMCRPGTNR
ncbi:hypothetical protein DTR82_24500 [Salmonella enterica subsp. enterica serovar Javiana]|nr:hypothetical protein [Salmonella enterica subsp. enterica serovar Javiana]